MLVKIIDRLSYQTYPIVEGMIEIPDEDVAKLGNTKCFDVENQSVIDYVKPQKNAIELYPLTVEKYIREKYTLSAELAILRQRDSKPEEFEEYNSYAESCKIIAKEKLGITEV